MIRSITTFIFAVFLFMGIHMPPLESGQGMMASATSLFVPAAMAHENEDSDDANSSHDENEDSDDTNNAHDENSASASAGILMCSAISTVEKKVADKEITEQETADSEKEAKEAKEVADAKKVEVEDEDDDSVSEDSKKEADDDAHEKETEYETAKKEHEDAESELNDALAELAAAQTASSASPCTTVGGNTGFWSNTVGTPAPTITTAPKSLREVHGQ